MGWQQTVLAGAAMLFLGFLIVKMWPGGSRRGALGKDVRAARDRAHAATTPRARAEALVEAARLSVRDGGRWTAAAGLFLRAMNSDPTWPDAVAQLAGTFHRRRPRLLEKILWRRLGLLPWDAGHRAALHEITGALARLYEGELRDKSRAEVLRRLAKSFEPG
ncbi:Hypothetical protein A7982_01937 [Minicystis rosea]|nr:Hypothetical protein A7982_01937 [Minicystis rosea]